MDWPACFPDLNPIEHPWDALGERFCSTLTSSGGYPAKLKQMLIDEWALLPARNVAPPGSDYGNKPHLLLKGLHTSVVSHNRSYSSHNCRGNAPAVQKMSRRAGDRQRKTVPPAQKSYYASDRYKAHHGRLMSSGTPALYR
ncbi:hypothetical protein TNCV_2671201 [Trichonephila clavipes]|nr:hypothetical protein TNCV_2671201 [Trichonephila clavipes]